MNDTILYRETLPKYVFNGDLHSTRGIRWLQWIYRATAVSFFIGTIFLMTLMANPDSNILVYSMVIVAMWIVGGIMLSISEQRQQAELDGSIPIIIHEDRISIPPRSYRTLNGEQNFINKEQIDRIEVQRGRGTQYFTEKDCIIWHNAPVGLKIVTQSGKKYNLGYKPPKTVREIIDLLATRWGVSIKDPGFGMGKGLKHVNNQNIGEFSYDEIMNMNILPWQ